ncbi:MAG: alpha/beta hydrolase [Pirellulales bacterium]
MRRFAALAMVFAWTACCGAQEPEVTPDVVYGHKDGLAMTYDAFVPAKDANGAAVLFMVSGGWYSNWQPPAQMRIFTDPLTKRGFTVFTVRHGSSPRYGIPDAVSDVRRAVRHIRSTADKWKIDPNRIGVYGMSAGGHLSLMLGTTGDDGKAADPDPVLRASDRVQAVVAYVAPTDLTIMVKDAPNRLPAYDKFPALNLDMAAAKAHSPLLQVTKDDAPTLLLAGAKDDLVPIDHSRRIHKAFEEQQVASKLVEYPNSGHGLGVLDLAASIAQMTAWFEQHLAKK